MDFDLSDEQRDVQRAAREFAQGEFDPDLASELEQRGQFPESIWKKASQLGFIGIHYPEVFGGQGLGLLENVLVIEAFCRVDSGIGCALSAVDLGSETILKYGSQEQKQRVLIPLAKGEKRLSLAFSESEDGRDLSSISTVAERREGKYLLFGEKRFAPNASLADTFLILCKERHEGWMILMVERGEDIEVRLVEKMGLRMIPSGDLQFKEVWVPSENRVGCGGEGMVVAHYAFQTMAIKSLAQALGVAHGAFDRAREYARQREQFGKKLLQFQIIRHKLADMAVAIEVMRWLAYQTAAEVDQGRMGSGFLSMAQLEVGRRFIWVVDEALQIFGGYGYIAEQAIEHYFRDAWAIGADLGTEEEAKDAIAAHILVH